MSLSLSWNRLESLRGPKSLSLALEKLGVYRIEIVRREMREGDALHWLTLPIWLKGSHAFIERIRQNEVGAEIIRKNQLALQEEAAKHLETVFRANGLGVSEIYVPLVLKGDKIGFLKAGGIVTEEPPPSETLIEDRLRVLMLSEDELDRAKKEWQTLPHFNSYKRAVVVQMLELLGREIIQFFEEDMANKEREELVHRYTFSQMVTNHPPIRQLLKKLPQIAESDSTVLIYGESGTGRELLARMIHERSRRQSKSFRFLHCASVSENLLEAELYGYEKGAFAGAYQTKEGLIQLCEGGTLYLKEIGDLSLSMQLKILKLMEDQSYQRLGSTESRPASVRIIASTQRNLKHLVQLGSFREDLYFRLGVVELELPPLRYRREDVELLAQHFLQTLGSQMGREGVQWKEEALQRLRAHGFPGNVRELKNEVERILAMKENFSFVELSDLSTQVTESLSPMDEIEKGRTLKSIVDAYEKRIIQEALSKYHWNKSRVAELFRITRQGLMKKITKHKLDKRKQV